MSRELFFSYVLILLICFVQLCWHKDFKCKLSLFVLRLLLGTFTRDYCEICKLDAHGSLQSTSGCTWVRHNKYGFKNTQEEEI